MRTYDLVATDCDRLLSQFWIQAWVDFSDRFGRSAYAKAYGRDAETDFTPVDDMDGR